MSRQYTAILSRARKRRIVGSIALAFLGLIVAPQVIRRALATADSATNLTAVFIVAVGVLIAVCVGMSFLSRGAPRTADHRYVARYLTEPLSLAVAAAKLVCMVLVVVLSVSVAIAALRGLVVLPESPLISGAVVALLAVPVLSSRRIPMSVIVLGLGMGIVATGAVLIGGLVFELLGGSTWDGVIGTNIEFAITEIRYGQSIPILGGIVAAVLPVALIGLMNERHFEESTSKRIEVSSLGKVMVPVFAGIGVTLYLAHQLTLPGRYFGTPVQVMARILFGEPGRIAISVALIVSMFSVALAAYDRMPGYLRMLAANGILPSRIAAADERTPRRLIIGSVVLICVAFSGVLQSALAMTHMTVVIMMTVVVLTMGSMVVRSRRVLADSTIPAERQFARRAAVTGFVVACVGMCVAVGAIIANPLVVVSSVLTISVPTLMLVMLRRRRGRIRQTLAPSDLTAARTMPTRVHGFVLVTTLDQPALQAISYARATRPSSLTALVVDVDRGVTDTFLHDWETAQIPVELSVLGTPKGASRQPIIEHIRSMRMLHPRDVFVVFYPRLVSASASLQRYAFTHSTPRLLNDLKLEEGVMVTEVPFHVDDLGGESE